MNTLLNHPLFPHGNQLFKSTINPFHNKLSHELIVAAHYIDTYAAACIEQKISFALRFGLDETVRLSKQDYSYKKLIDYLSIHTTVIMKGHFELKHAPYLMSLGLYKTQPSKPCNFGSASISRRVPIYIPSLSSEIELETIRAKVYLVCTQDFEETLNFATVFNPIEEVRNYASQYLDELMALIGDKLVHAIHPVPEKLEDNHTVHLVIKKKDVGVLDPLNLDPEKVGDYTELGAVFYTRGFELHITILLI